MSKKILALALLCLMLFAVGCQGNNGQAGNEGKNGNQSNSEGGGGSLEEKNENGEFFFKGIVKSKDSTGHLLAEIIDSEVASGEYIVLYDDMTDFFDGSGKSVTINDVRVGDTIEIIFSGQVMLSYPAQIYANKIKILE